MGQVRPFNIKSKEEIKIMTLIEKNAYIKGLADGLDLDKTTAEGKLIAALIDLTSELCAEIEEINEDIVTLHDYAEELDEDLGAVEEYLLDELKDDCDCCDCDDDCDDCDCCDCCGDCDDCDCDGDCDNCECLESCVCGECDCCDCGEDFDEDYYEIECPACGETVCFDTEVDLANLTCPACNEKFSCECDEDDLKFLDGDDE